MSIYSQVSLYLCMMTANHMHVHAEINPSMIFLGVHDVWKGKNVIIAKPTCFAFYRMTHACRTQNFANFDLKSMHAVHSCQLYSASAVDGDKYNMYFLLYNKHYNIIGMKSIKLTLLYYHVSLIR